MDCSRRCWTVAQTCGLRTPTGNTAWTSRNKETGCGNGAELCVPGWGVMRHQTVASWGNPTLQAHSRDKKPEAQSRAANSHPSSPGPWATPLCRWALSPRLHQPPAPAWLMCPLFPKSHSPFLLPTRAFSSPWCVFEGKLTFLSQASSDLGLCEALPG